MPFDHLDRISWPDPASLAEAAAAARGAELALAKRLSPGEDWATVPSGVDMAFDAQRESFRVAHARACDWADETADDPDPDAWEDESGED